MTETFGVIAALFALLGTTSQAVVGLKQLKEADPEGHRAFVAVDDLSTEFAALRHPVKWSGRRREMKQLLAESPEEARLYRRVLTQIWGWVLLAVASMFALIAALVGG